MKLFFKTQYDADLQGYFGEYGGRYVPEALIPALDKLNIEYQKAKKDPSFRKDYVGLLQTFVGRPSPLLCAHNLTQYAGGAQIYLKNEGNNLTGSHKINHCIGQGLIALRMKKKVLIAETGAGQHGVATATVASKFGMKCIVFMGVEDMKRQAPNVLTMRMLGADVREVSSGSQTLKDAVNAAIKYWISHINESHYVLGSCLGPHPYPSMNRDFQSIIGVEIAQEMQKRYRAHPHYVVACVGGGSNAMGAFNYFLDNPKVQLVGIEAGGKGIHSQGQHASRMQVGSGARLGILHGYKSIFLQTSNGNIACTHSISAGLDYPGIGPQLAHLHKSGRVKFSFATDTQALGAMRLLAHYEGIIPALESAHAVAYGIQLAQRLKKNLNIVINISGRGDKDLLREEVQGL